MEAKRLRGSPPPVASLGAVAVGYGPHRSTAPRRSGSAGAEPIAEAKAARENAGGRESIPTCDGYVARYLAEYEERNRESSTEGMTQRLARFRRDFAGAAWISPLGAKRLDERVGAWSHRPPIPVGYRPAVVTLYNYAMDEDDFPLEKTPARKLGKRTKSKRSQTPPPTEEEFQRLLDACDALGDYAPRMRELMLFAAYESMRPSELYSLHESKIDFERMRILKDARIWRGAVGSPKTGEVIIR